MPYQLIFSFIITSLVICTSCQNSETTAVNATNDKPKHTPSPVIVTTSTAQIKTFYRELLCNGKIEAGRTARVCFEVQGMVNAVHVKNGQLLNQGQLIAELDSLIQYAALIKAQNALERAKVDMDDILFGYSSKLDTSSMPRAVIQTARIRSGYNDAVLALQDARLQLLKTKVTAPINGRVADLQILAHNPSSSVEYVCNIIDESSLQVKFQILETEIEMVSIGTKVVVTPFSNLSHQFEGKVTEVNPRVEKSGMVLVVASVSNASGTLLPGMNVKVIVQNDIPNQLVIPRQGLTIRQNKHVVFTLNDTLAIWNYVEVGLENTNEVIIVKGINEGDRIIVSGNTTIGHEAWVREDN